MSVYPGTKKAKPHPIHCLGLWGYHFVGDAAAPAAHRRLGRAGHSLAGVPVYRHLRHLCYGAGAGGYSTALDALRSRGDAGAGAAGRPGLCHPHVPGALRAAPEDRTVPADDDGFLPQYEWGSRSGPGSASRPDGHLSGRGAGGGAAGHKICPHFRTG